MAQCAFWTERVRVGDHTSIGIRPAAVGGGGASAAAVVAAAAAGGPVAMSSGGGGGRRGMRGVTWSSS